MKTTSHHRHEAKTTTTKKKKKQKKTHRTKLFHEAFFREIVGIKIHFPPNYKKLLSLKFFL
jgi:hypothetical protein